MPTRVTVCGWHPVYFDRGLERLVWAPEHTWRDCGAWVYRKTQAHRKTWSRRLHAVKREPYEIRHYSVLIDDWPDARDANEDTPDGWRFSWTASRGGTLTSACPANLEPTYTLESCLAT